ncbi:MAG: hypothetical protein HFI72_04410 [Peptococcaceae bacterium]|nr:hypothetical protein [Peptococcaceae bacterium]
MVPPIPQAAWAAPSSTGTLAGSFAPQSNKIYPLANGGDYSLQSADISSTAFVLSSGSATLRVPAGQTVKINDAGSGCSPISLSGSGKLTLIVDGTLVVTGGAGEKGSTSVTDAAKGYAGISVPSGTNLVIKGTGSLTANGGHAGDGGDANIATNGGAGGGGGAGAGIGGDGGVGGRRAAGNGGVGVSAGSISIYETVKVFAYGGAGGAGGTSDHSNISSGQPGSGGGGGYPAAGIGGGGAGGGAGDAGSGAGGFSGGMAEITSGASKPVRRASDGLAHPEAPFRQGTWWMNPGNGYFQAGAANEVEYRLIGGGGAHCYIPDSPAGANTLVSGHGGQSGAGGIVYRANTATLTVVNGSYKTASKAWGSNPTPIYAQSGYDLALLRTAGVTNVNARTKSALESELGTKGKSSSIKATALAGVGSGAGYTESSNGSFTIQKVPE